MSGNQSNHGLYPIIRRVRRPLIDLAAEASPVVPAEPEKKPESEEVAQADAAKPAQNENANG